MTLYQQWPIKFVVAQSSLLLFTFIVVILNLTFSLYHYKTFYGLPSVGFSMNLIGISAVILAGINKKAITTIINPIIHFLGKIKILKHPDDIIEKLSTSIDNFREQFKIIRSEKKMIFKNVYCFYFTKPC